MKYFLSFNIFSPFLFYDIKYTVTSKKKKGFLMEKYQMSGGCRRSGNCGMPCAVPYTDSCANTSQNSYKKCQYPSPDNNCTAHTSSMYSHLSHLPVAMAYVPCQIFTQTYDTPYALMAGTIFPDLCKPFCGKRGMMR